LFRGSLTKLTMPFSGLHIGFFDAIAGAPMGPLPPVPVPYEMLSEEGRILHELTEMWRNGARFPPPVQVSP
jgi:hypothetical protein